GLATFRLQCVAACLGVYSRDNRPVSLAIFFSCCERGLRFRHAQHIYQPDVFSRVHAAVRPPIPIFRVFDLRICVSALSPRCKCYACHPHSPLRDAEACVSIF
ncbi:unnamed protein product, partial [Scytosiphon promiscuus]